MGDLVIRSFLRLKQNYQHYTIRKHTIQTTTKNNGSFYLSNQQVSVETKPATYEEMTKLTKTLYPGIRTYMAVYLFLQPVVVQLLLVSNGRKLNWLYYTCMDIEHVHRKRKQKEMDDKTNRLKKKITSVIGWTRSIGVFVTRPIIT